MSTPQLAAIPCNCPARLAPAGTDAHEEHEIDCTFRPLCRDANCHNFGKAMVIVEDDIEALVFGGYDCPPQAKVSASRVSYASCKRDLHAVGALHDEEALKPNGCPIRAITLRVRCRPSYRCWPRSAWMPSRLSTCGDSLHDRRGSRTCANGSESSRSRARCENTRPRCHRMNVSFTESESERIAGLADVKDLDSRIVPDILSAVVTVLAERVSPTDADTYTYTFTREDALSIYNVLGRAAHPLADSFRESVDGRGRWLCEGRS